MRRRFLVLLAVFSLAVVSSAQAQSKKILWIEAYHVGYPWSDGLAKGLENALKDSGAELKIHHMDTKNNPSPEFAQKAAEEAKKVIDEYKPDVVIASDDNPSKLIIKPYFKDAAIPFVFCGLNWDSSIYGFPYKNVTGMEEIALVPQVIDGLKKYAKGERIGWLAADVETSRKDATYMQQRFKLSITESYATSFEDWKAKFKELQSQVDMLFVDIAGIKDFNKDEAAKFVEENTTIPTGGFMDYVAPYVLMSYAKSAEEQGDYAARTALQILGGKPASEIPIVQNKIAKLYLNMKVAKKLGVVFDIGLVKQAELIK